MNFARAAMGRNRTTRGDEWLRVFFPEEEQEHLSADRVSTEACVTGDDPQTEDVFVKSRGSFEIVHMKSGFENTGDGGHEKTSVGCGGNSTFITDFETLASAL